MLALILCEDQADMRWIGRMHGGLVYVRRTQVLAKKLGEHLPSGATVLDIGCGDGLIDKLIMRNRPDVAISGVDVLARRKLHIPVDQFDGCTLPYESASVDAVLLVDVLHHVEDPTVLLKEAARVARRAVIIKDHFENGWWDRLTLRFMDWVGNAHHGVALPYNYWRESRWRDAFTAVGLHLDSLDTSVGLYPFLFSFVFDRKLHFVARLEVSRVDGQPNQKAYA